MKSVNLLEVGSVGTALRIGRERWEGKHGILDTQRRCREMCHKACYVETAALGTVGGVVEVMGGQLKQWWQQSGESYYGLSPKERRSGKSPNAQRERAEIDAMPVYECDGPCRCSGAGGG
jgi:hypothetical protein